MVADRGVGKRFPRIGVLFGLVITLIKESWSCFFFFSPPPWLISQVSFLYRGRACLLSCTGLTDSTVKLVCWILIPIV